MASADAVAQAAAEAAAAVASDSSGGAGGGGGSGGGTGLGFLSDYGDVANDKNGKFWILTAVWVFLLLSCVLCGMKLRRCYLKYYKSRRDCIAGPRNSGDFSLATDYGSLWQQWRKDQAAAGALPQYNDGYDFIGVL